MRRVAVLAWMTLVVNIIVILGGALVRATGSGAGCGNSWPTCEGQLVPAEIGGALAVEFLHRVLSGIALLMVIVLFVAVRRATPRRDATLRHRQLRIWAGWALVTIIGEALIGAGIVLFEWVNEDASIARTIAVPLHLVNTFLLLGALALLVWNASGGGEVRSTGAGRGRRAVFVGLGLMVLVAASGAVTALADTLFPKTTIGLADVGPTETFLTNMRVVHPAIAVAAGLILVRIVHAGRPHVSARAGQLAGAVVVIVVAQLVAGTLNVILLVPVWMQLVHLALADILWIVFVWYGAETLAVAPSTSRTQTPTARAVPTVDPA